jgi:CRP-like cAMP-binding protein
MSEGNYKEKIMKDSELGRKYSDNEIICREGEEGKNMFVVQSGKVDVIKKMPEGEMILTTLKKGEVFGEMALFDRLPRSATVRASGDAVVLSVDKKGFFSKAGKDPTLAFHILEGMSRRIRSLNDALSRFKKTRDEIMGEFLDLDGTVNIVLDEIRGSIKADNGSIMLLDEKNETLNIIGAFGENATEKTRLKIGDGIAGDVLKTGKIELINNISDDSRFKPGHMSFSTLMCAPLKARDMNFGVINLSNSGGKLFNLEDMKCLRVLSSYASIAIENARMFSKTSKLDNSIVRHATLLDMG